MYEPTNSRQIAIYAYFINFLTFLLQLPVLWLWGGDGSSRPIGRQPITGEIEMFIQSKSFLAMALAATTFVGTAQGALIYEPFSQDLGGLSGKPAGTGLVGNWTSTAPNVIVSPALSYGILPNAGNQVNVPTGQAAGNASATTSSVLSDAGLLNNGATLWFSVVTTGASGSNQHSGFAFGNAAIAPSFDGARLAGDALGFYTRQGNVQAAAWSLALTTVTNNRPDSLSSALSAPQSATNFIVGKIEWGATPGDNEIITLYKPNLADLVLPGTSVTTSIAGLNQASFNIVSFASRQGAQSFDEIRFGASYDEVIGVVAAPAVPEPATATLGLLAVGGLMMRRRRA